MVDLTKMNLEELKALADELLAKSDEAENVTEKKKIEEKLEEVINTYTAHSKNLCYAYCRDSGDPLKTAVLEFAFPCIKVKEVKDESGLVIRSIVDVMRPIDLGDLHKKLNGVGANKNWIYAAEKLNFYLTVRAANRLGKTVKSDAYRMNEIARDFDMGKNPVSNTNLLKTLQTVITAMLGEGYKAVSHDVNYLVDVYAQDNKKSKTGVTAANHRTLRNYLKKVCYRILTDGTGYDVETREIRDK